MEWLDRVDFEAIAERLREHLSEILVQECLNKVRLAEENPFFSMYFVDETTGLVFGVTEAGHHIVVQADTTSIH